MTIARQRTRQIPRPVPPGAPAVRHDVLATWPDGGPAIKIAAGIAIEAEARIRYRAAVEEAESTDEEATIILERVTVETLEIHAPGDEEIRPMEITLTDARGTRAHKVERPLDLIAAISRAFRVPLALLRREPDAASAFRTAHEQTWELPADAPPPAPASKFEPIGPRPMEVRCMWIPRGGIPAALDMEAIAVAAFAIAASHQGGHSTTGKRLAEALAVPFPLTMPDLAERAMAVGLDPRRLWPWWEPTRAAPEAVTD